MAMKEIQFHITSKENGWLSNFAPYPVELDGKVWPTSEHYYQAQKYLLHDPEYAEKIRSKKYPRSAFERGRNPDRVRRNDWDEIMDEVMLKTVRAKFSQYDNIKEMLLNTKDAVITEHTPDDAYWGDGGDGSGLNKLGKILMQVREELKDKDE